MTATPDGISMADLMALHESAAQENVPQLMIDDRPVDEFIQSVEDATDALHKAHSHPMTAKKLIMDNLAVLMHWHTDRGMHEFNDGEGPECGVCWLRDAGKLQAAMQLVHSVVLPDDFISGADTENSSS